MPGRAGGSGFAAGQRRFRAPRASARRRKRRCVGPKMAAGMYLEHYLDSKSRRGGAEAAAEPARGARTGRGAGPRGGRALPRAPAGSPRPSGAARCPGRAEGPRPWGKARLRLLREP